MQKFFFSLILIITGLYACHTSKPIVLSPDASLFIDEEYQVLLYYNADFFKTNSLYLYPNKNTIIQEKNPVYISQGTLNNTNKFYPGDSIQVSINKKGNINYYISNNGKRNTEIKAANLLDSLMKVNNERLFAKTYSVDSFDIIQEMNEVVYHNFFVQSILPRLKNLHTLNISAWDSISKQYAISKQLKEEIYDYIYYLTAIKMNYSNNAQNKNIEQKTENLKQRINFIDSIYNQRKDNFLYHVQLYDIQTTLRQLHGLPTPIKTESDYWKEYHLIDTNYKGGSKEYLLTDLMYRTVSRNTALNKNIKNNFFKNISNKGYRQFITSEIKQSEKIRADKTSALIDTDNNKHTWEAILKAHKGKIILVDLWATWCAPCIEEFPYGKKLKESFIEHDFVIVYMSIDKNKEIWRIKSKEFDFPDNACFALAAIRYPKEIEEHIKRTIPQYILIGKDGNIINADAPRPSDPALRKLIEENL